MDTTVPEFYDGQSIFITGATGFMGKACLEKLMRSCPGIKRFYLLVRARNNKTAQERLAELLDGELFARAKKEQPDSPSKIRLVDGELGKENLGMSPEVLAELRAEVTIIFHIAATVKFNESLPSAVEMNVIAPRRMLQFAKSCKTIRAFIHVSTAYAHTNRSKIEEVVYPSAIDPERLIELSKLVDDDMAKLITPHLVGERPNTYTFTKSVAEYLMQKEGHGIPIAIVRPSIITPSWREPFPGWIDNFNGPSGLVLAIGTGIMQVLPGRANALSDLIPIDIVANFTLTVPWYVTTRMGESWRDGPVVFNCTSGNMNRLDWGTMVSSAIVAFNKFPLEKRVFRRPSLTIYSPGTWKLQWLRMFYHSAPASLVDYVMSIQGHKPQLKRAVHKMDRTLAEFTFFTSSSWMWDTKHGEQMQAALNDVDRNVFNSDMSQLHWGQYMETFIIGVKKFLLLEDMARVHLCRKAQRRMMIISLVTKVVGVGLLVRFLMPYLRKYGLAKSFWLLLAPAILMMRV